MVNLDEIKKDLDKALSSIKKRIIICAGTGCVANGSIKVYEEFLSIAKKNNFEITIDLKKEDEGKDISLASSGCQGFCQMGPLVTILPDEILYTKVKASDVIEIFEESIKKNNIIDRLLYLNPSTKETCKGVNEIPFYTRQKRIMLKNCGRIDAESINEYIRIGGYLMAKKTVLEMSSEQICKEILESGLRGRGGGGFPTGKKWEFTRIEKSEKKYLICNGDEGDPGAFMDRSVMEGNPHLLIEGMIIAAIAVGADEGYVYVRTEYPLAVKRVEKAIKDATETGILGENIFDSGKKFNLHVMEGAGAFVCGEETALMASVEGKRGMPTPKPPFPAQKGLFGKPTVINNVETLATVPIIMQMGANEFKKIGTPNSSGTKTFAITGHVINTGLIEVPFGTTIGEIIGDIAGGVIDENGKIDNDAFKAVQIGGPSGGCLTKKDWNLPVEYETLKAAGAMVGSGGLVVMNNTTCMVQIADFFMQFTQNESCGKCVPCREGTKQIKAMLEDIRNGNSNQETLNHLKNLAKVVQKASLCGLGKTAPNPVLSTLKNFEDEYHSHVFDKRCHTGQCANLTIYEILDDKCVGCSACSRKCPVGAITGELKKNYKINQSLCIKCGVCQQTCKFGAIVKK
ncbi:MAG: 4Fe-4S binding protein [Elusimicrobiota bacterium]|jgi:NADH-quinone oxidoreductase subunit F|nr:4Fe-4S binding protein [Elusimicrobiota bacterium]